MTTTKTTADALVTARALLQDIECELRRAKNDAFARGNRTRSVRLTTLWKRAKAWLDSNNMEKVSDE